MIKAQKLFYVLAFSPSLFVLAGNLMGGEYATMNMVYSLILLIILDFFAPSDHSTVPDDNQILSNIILLSASFVHLLCITSFVYAVVNNLVTGKYVWFAAISTGLNAGMLGITAAHELIHRKDLKFRILGILNLFLVFYSHFYIEHRKGHHAKVGTAEDPATARFNENFYKFFVRSVIGQYKSALNIESLRLKRLKRAKYGFENFVVYTSILQTVWILMIYVIGGKVLALSYLLMALIAVALLEYVNYIEHYGLERKPGEKVNESHAWQSDTWLSRYFLFELSRHAHHHIDAQVPYHNLTSFSHGRFLPKGYFGMFYIGLIPPLWFKIVNPLIKAE